MRWSRARLSVQLVEGAVGGEAGRGSERGFGFGFGFGFGCGGGGGACATESAAWPHLLKCLVSVL